MCGLGQSQELPVKDRLTHIHVLALQYFGKISEVACYALDLGGVLGQEGHPITLLSKKLK